MISLLFSFYWKIAKLQDGQYTCNILVICKIRYTAIFYQMLLHLVQRRWKKLTPKIYLWPIFSSMISFTRIIPISNAYDWTVVLIYASTHSVTDEVSFRRYSVQFYLDKDHYLDFKFVTIGYCAWQFAILIEKQSICIIQTFLGAKYNQPNNNDTGKDRHESYPKHLSY